MVVGVVCGDRERKVASVRDGSGSLTFHVSYAPPLNYIWACGILHWRIGHRGHGEGVSGLLFPPRCGGGGGGGTGGKGGKAALYSSVFKYLRCNAIAIAKTRNIYDHHLALSCLTRPCPPRVLCLPNNYSYLIFTTLYMYFILGIDTPSRISRTLRSTRTSKWR